MNATDRLRGQLRASLANPPVDNDEVLTLGVAAEIAGMHILKIAGRLEAAYQTGTEPPVGVLFELRTHAINLTKALDQWERAEALRRGRAKMAEVE